MINISVNGKSFQCNGSSVSIVNNKIIVDDKEVTNVTPNMADKAGNIKIVVIGNIDNLICWGDVEVQGNCNDVDCRGNCDVNGYVGGDIDAGGNVSCKDIAGDVFAHGNVRCATISGDVDAGGNVRIG